MAMLSGGRGRGQAAGRRCLSSGLLNHLSLHLHLHLHLTHRRYIQALAQHFPRSPTPTPTTPIQVVADSKVVDMKKWRKLDSKSLGIVPGVIPHGPWTVMKILRNHGFDAYLVGGCVRDLLLKKTPKDFDVITTANLDQIKKEFHRAVVVGSRFPICLVHIQDSVTEVSSFETVAKHSVTKEEVDLSPAPLGCKKQDFIRWKDSLKRDFTINSLFFDPFSNKVYDYSSGISDLRSLKLRTIIPAEVSFEEDCARILRGLRIAARLGLSFSKDTEAALYKLSQTITNLPKGRIFMELNYMLSYGAAESSLSLLQRFSLLEIILPFHAAYLEQHPNGKPENTTMLMKLFSNLDKVVRCDHPSDCRLWVGLLAFHLALVNKPQDAFVAITMASILYHGEWTEGIRYARENAGVQVHFKPELSSSLISKSDKELAEEVSQLAASVRSSIHVLTESDCLQESMSRYPTSSCSSSVFVPNRVGRDVAEVFQMLLKHNSSHEKRRESVDIDYQLLGKGYMWETRFVLGKIILETMGCATLQRDGETVEEKNNNIDTEVIDQNCKTELSSLLGKHLLIKTLRCSEANQKSDMKSKLDVTLGEEEIVERKMCQDIAKKYQKADETDKLAKEDMFDLEVTGKEKEDEKPSTKKICELSDVDIMKGANRDIKKHRSKDNRPYADKGQKSQDEEVMEETRGGIKKQLRRITDKNRESLDGEVIEKKGSTKKKRKSKDESPSMDKRRELPDQDVMEKKEGDIKKKRKRKDVRPSVDEEFESLGEVVMEEKKGDVKKKKRKSKDERPSNMDEEFVDEVTEKKKRESKKNLRQRKDHRLSVEKGCDQQDEVVIVKKKGTSKNGQLKSKDQPTTMVKKKHRVPKEDKAADQQEVARKKTNGGEGKQVVRNENTSWTLLSSLFG